MEPEPQRQLPENPAAMNGSLEPARQPPIHLHTPPDTPHEHTAFDRIFVGPNGLRAGWSILLFYAIFFLLRLVAGTVFYAAGLIGETMDNSAQFVLVAELVPFLSLLAAAAIMALLEGRRFSSYNLAGPRRARRFATGAVAGFSALSLQIAALAWGGWLHVAPGALTAAQTLRLAVLWGGAFLIVASVEEGLFRCYALSTLARGIDFRWALAAQAVVCVDAFIHSHRNGAWGVYLAAVLGLVPCFVLHQRGAALSSRARDEKSVVFPGLAVDQRSAARSAFWQAAWVTSTVFGLYHTMNNGENWVGVFGAAAIGFVFCLSVRLTGSVWWAIGFHAAWDWAETFSYGTADSGLQGQGHLFSASPTGNPLWSGGADGPEGSLLVLGVILLLILFLSVVYGRGRHAASAGAQIASS